LSHLDATPRSTSELANLTGLAVTEAAGVLNAFKLADWVDTGEVRASGLLVALESDAASANTIRGYVDSEDSGWTGHVVRDEFSLLLLLKRKSPRAVLVSLEGDVELNFPAKLDRESLLNGEATVVGIVPQGSQTPVAPQLGALPLLHRPFTGAELAQALSQPRPNLSAAPASTPEPAGVNS